MWCKTHTAAGVGSDLHQSTSARERLWYGGAKRLIQSIVFVGCGVLSTLISIRCMVLSSTVCPVLCETL